MDELAVFNRKIVDERRNFGAFNTVMGNESDINEFNKTTIVGSENYSYNHRNVIVGSNNKCTHENVNMIGNNLVSVSDNTTQIGKIIVTDDTITVDNFSIIYNNGHCDFCDTVTSSSLKWNNKTLCMDCIFNTVSSHMSK